MTGGSRVAPAVGMDATVTHYAVREAATIVEVSDRGRRVTVRVESDGQLVVFTLRASGRFIQTGEDANGGTRLGVGRHPV